jgi:hypothetical protein
MGLFKTNVGDEQRSRDSYECLWRNTALGIQEQLRAVYPQLSKCHRGIYICNGLHRL